VRLGKGRRSNDAHERLDRIDEAFLHERSIDRQTYERQRDQLREQLALAEIELADAVLDQFDVEVFSALRSIC
jgi:hypothetical protein